MGIRTFIAISISDEAWLALAQFITEMKQHGSGLKWVNAQNIHLTLKFLGDVAEGRKPELQRALDKSVENIDPFYFEIAGKGFFPSSRRPRVLWVGVQDPSQELSELHKNVEHELEQLGFAPERRKFQPHLTLARVKNPHKLGSIIEEFEKYEMQKFRVDVSNVILMKSDLHPTGAKYTPQYVAAL